MSSINTLKPSGILLLVSLHILISVKGNGQVHAGFTVSSETVCSGSSVIFSDNSDGTTDETIYFWDFGTGALPATANGIGPHIVTYSSPGKSSVSLTVTDDGSSDTKTKTDYITINTLPEVTFSVSLPIQCISSSDYTLTGGLPDGGTYSGAGISGTSFNATIAGLGIHTITYSYIDGNGCAGSAINTIEVIDVPASPDVTVINNCDGTSVLSTTSSGSLLWSTSETTSSITVTSAGVYSVTTTIDGCSSLPGIGTAVP
jgi:PKD repeat protein